MRKMTVASKSILIVDSERLLADFFGSALPAAQVQVLAALNCDEAKAVLAKISVDLMLINPSLPGAMQLVYEATKRGIEVVRKTDAMSEVFRLIQLRLGMPV